MPVISWSRPAMVNYPGAMMHPFWDISAPEQDKKPQIVEDKIPVPLTAMKAAQVDSQDGLTAQYHLKTSLPSLPIGAAELIELLLVTPKDINEGERRCYRIRLHAKTRFYDFPFVLLL